MALRSLLRMALVTQRNAQVHGGPMLDAALISGFVGSRGIQSRRDVITENADGAFAALTVAASSIFAGVWYWMKDTEVAGVWYWMKDTDTSDVVLMEPEDPSMKTDVVLMGPEDPAMKTDSYLRRQKASADVERSREAYNEAVVEDMDDGPDMRARFEDWIKKYGRTYKDEAEKARRFKIFQAFARFVDVSNAEVGSRVQFGLTKFADWNSQEIRSICRPRYKKRVSPAVESET